MVNLWNNFYICIETDHYSRIDFIRYQCEMGNRLFKIKKIEDDRYLMFFKPFIMDECSYKGEIYE